MTCIAIDGPSGSGKSTVSKILARKLGFVNVDTGALYRGIAYYFYINNVDFRKIENLTKILKDITIKIENSNYDQRIFLNGEDITDNIRSEKISKLASEISSLPEVRSHLLKLQREIAKNRNVVMDGRDIGTVVIPDAKVKIFLTASPQLRAKRRYKQLNEKVSYTEILKDITKRDENDSNREICPLKKSEDAIVFDNSSYTLEETANKLLDIIKERVEN